MKILILGRHAGMMQNVISFLGQQGFADIKGVLTNEEVIDELSYGIYNVIVIGGGVDGETRKIIRELVADKKNSIKIVEHYGNLATLINEIKT